MVLSGAFWLVVVALAWLFTTTPEPLSHVIQTAVGRTVAGFMVITPVGVAHLLAVMTDSDGEPVMGPANGNRT